MRQLVKDDAIDARRAPVDEHVIAVAIGEKDAG